MPAAELDRNIAFFRQLFQMAADRGLDTYLVTWNIHVSRAFAEQHSIAAAGFDSPLVRDYQREAIKALFATYPMLTGLGTTIGERMPNLTTQQKLDWVADTYFAALRASGPAGARSFCATGSPSPSRWRRCWRRSKYPGPVYLDIKFNGEHMYSSVKPHVLDRSGWTWRAADTGCSGTCATTDLSSCVGAIRISCARPCAICAGRKRPGSSKDRNSMCPARTASTPRQRRRTSTGSTSSRSTGSATCCGDGWAISTRANRTTPGGRTSARRFGAGGRRLFEAMRQAGKIVPLITSYHWNYMNGDWYPEGSIGTWNTSYEQPRPNYRRAAMYHDIRTYIFNNTIDSSFANIPEFRGGTRRLPGRSRWRTGWKTSASERSRR